jgi:hypothetical protein
MHKRYGRQFQKLLQILRSDFLPAVAQKKDGQSVVAKLEVCSSPVTSCDPCSIATYGWWQQANSAQGWLGDVWLACCCLAVHGVHAIVTAEDTKRCS